MHWQAVGISLESLLFILMFCHPSVTMPTLRHRLRHQKSERDSTPIVVIAHDDTTGESHAFTGSDVTVSDGVSLSSGDGIPHKNVSKVWDRTYIPWLSVPLPDINASLDRGSNVHMIWDRVWGSTAKSKNKSNANKNKANLTILPLCTLLVMLVFICVKMSRWWHDDIREADDKMLLFHMPGSIQWAHAHKPRLPQRGSSCRRRGGSRHSNSTSRTDSRRSRKSGRGVAMTPVIGGEGDRYSPREIRRLQKHGSKASLSSGRQPKAGKAMTRGQRHPLKRTSGARGEKRTRRRSAKPEKGIKEGLAMIAMPLELHFTHFLRQQHEHETASISSPSSLGRSTSTVLSDTASLSHLRRSDSERSRNTSYDSGAVANSSQSSSQTDVTSFTDTTTTGFSSESVSSPKRLASPVGKPYRGKGLPLAEYYAKHLALWRHHNKYYGDVTVMAAHSPSDEHKDLGMMGEPLIVAPSLSHKPRSGERRRRKLGLAGLHPSPVMPSHVLSPYGTPGDVDMMADLWGKESPRSSSSSGTEATVRYSPTKSGRSSLQDADPGMIRTRSSESISSVSTVGHVHPQSKQTREVRHLSIIPSPVGSSSSADSSHSPGDAPIATMRRSLSGNLKMRYSAPHVPDRHHVSTANCQVSQSEAGSYPRNPLARHTWCFGDKSCVISDKSVIKLAADKLASQTTSV